MLGLVLEYIGIVVGVTIGAGALALFGVAVFIGAFGTTVSEEEFTGGDHE